jgi:hypothetical protein
MNRVRNFLILLRQQLQVVPMLMCFMACFMALLLAYALVTVAPILAPRIVEGESGWPFSGDAATARAFSRAC